MSRTRHHGQKAKERAFGKSWRWLQATPSWWTRMMMTAPQRRETRDKLRQAEKDPEAAITWPLAKKPHNYYF